MGVSPSASHKVHCGPKVHAMTLRNDFSKSPRNDTEVWLFSAARGNILHMSLILLLISGGKKASAGLQLCILGSNQTKLLSDRGRKTTQHVVHAVASLTGREGRENSAECVW